jgi:hypothetical protein
MEEGRMKGRWIGSFIGILAVVAVSFVWSPPVGATDLSSKAVPMSGGPNCGKRAKVYDRIWSVKAHDHRVVFLRCGEFPNGPSEGWGWRHIMAKQHPAQLGWDQDYFMWAMQQTVQGADPKYQPNNATFLYSAPIFTIRFDNAAGSYFRDEYTFKVIVIRRNGDVITAYGDYLRTTNCHTIERCKEYP